MGNVLRRTFQIDRWEHWDHRIHAGVQDFRARFTVTPNILVANEITLARIDMAAAKANIRDRDGVPAEEGAYTPLDSFIGPDYRLDLCIDPNLPDASFSLIYDEDPDGGGEPVPDEDTPDPSEVLLCPVLEKRRRSA